ncbi:hypothetical protein QYF36_023644 [Acer negundo]|nr:hypothetical protein QYF36_023644 [Acer negundo]
MAGKGLVPEGECGRELASSQECGRDYTTMHKLVGGWSRFPDEPKGIGSRRGVLAGARKSARGIRPPCTN